MIKLQMFKRLVDPMIVGYFVKKKQSTSGSFFPYKVQYIDFSKDIIVCVIWVTVTVMVSVYVVRKWPTTSRGDAVHVVSKITKMHPPLVNQQPPLDPLVAERQRDHIIELC